MASATATALDHQYCPPRYNPWLVAFTVTLATFMEILDTSIANIALPHIAGSFGASPNESTWVLTSYLVANGIVLPVSAWLATRLGRKRFYMWCVAIFATSSFLCGLAPSLGMLVLFRIFQGAGGGGLQPSEQAILADTFPASKRGMAFSIYGMAVVAAPAIGPTFGGWLTDNFSWRWIFYINVPISIISLYMTHRFVEDPPYLREEQAKKKGASIDYVGFSLVALGVGSLQMVLDKGQDADWFASHWITATLALAVVVLAVWVVWEWRHPHPIVELKLLKMRNFAAAIFFMFVLGMVLYGTTVLIPEFLQLQMGYPAVVAGEAMAGGGLIMMVMMPASGILTGKMDPRKLMVFGFAATAFGLYYMATHLTLGMDFRTVFMVRVYQMAGLAFVFIPSNVLCYVGIPREKNNQISSMTNFIRNVGGSIGIALTSTMVVRATQARQNYLVANLQSGNPKYHQAVEGLAGMLHSRGLSVSQAAQQAYVRVDYLMRQQAAVVAYKDVVATLALVIVCLIPLAFIMKRPPVGRVEPPPVH